MNILREKQRVQGWMPLGDGGDFYVQGPDAKDAAYAQLFPVLQQWKTQNPNTDWLHSADLQDLMAKNGAQDWQYGEGAANEGARMAVTGALGTGEEYLNKNDPGYLLVHGNHYAGGLGGMGGFLQDAAKSPVASLAISALAPELAPGLTSSLGAAGAAGVINGGVNLLQTGNLDSAFKAGATGAVLNGVGGIANSYAPDGIAGSLFKNAVNGGARTLLNGGDLGKALTNSVIDTAGGYAGSQVGGYGGDIANQILTDALRGKQTNIGNLAQRELYKYGNNSLFKKT